MYFFEGYKLQFYSSEFGFMEVVNVLDIYVCGFYYN